MRGPAAACLAALALLTSGSPAAAYPCGQTPPPPVGPRELTDLDPVDKCELLERAKKRSERSPRKRGNLSGLTVFVLAVGGALLFAVGRSGPPRSGDPFGHDRLV